MIYTTKLKTDLRSREILPGNFEESLLVCMKATLDRYSRKRIPWHWHDSFEVDYVQQGEIELRTADHVWTIRQGDLFFINQSVMHEYRAVGETSCVAYSILFDMHYLSGVYNSQLERKYMLPVKESGIEVYAFSPDSPARLGMAHDILDAIDLLQDEPYGYEMLVRSKLSSFWTGLLQDTEQIRSTAEKTGSVDTERIKKMLEYVHTSYAEKLTAESIAASADVSVRECGRCFERCIGMPPVKYLTQYRVYKASEMLLETDLSILDISEACGFSSSSYFGKVFSEAMGCTPKAYRTSGGIRETTK